jgi:hypothetical protein
VTRPRSDASETIAVDDPWRFALRSPVFGTLLLALLFFLYTAPIKETPSLFDHAPWLNDPFDTVISFMMFFVPLIAISCAPRVLLCRRFEPLLASRIRDVLRGCRVVLAGVSLTLLVEWVSFAIEDNRATWNWATWIQIGLLSLMTVVDLVAVVGICRITLPNLRKSTSNPDWLSDTILLAKTKSRLLGPLGRPIDLLISFVEQSLLATIRRHPVWTALFVCAVFAAGVGTNQAVREGYRVSVAEVVVVLLATGMFGLVTSAGAYLGLIRSIAPCRGAKRRLLDSSVIMSVGILVPFALRYHLWWLVGSTNAAAGLAQLLGLLALSGIVIFGTTYIAESLLGLHSEPLTRAA